MTTLGDLVTVCQVQNEIQLSAVEACLTAAHVSYVVRGPGNPFEPRGAMRGYFATVLVSGEDLERARAALEQIWPKDAKGLSGAAE